MSDFMVKPPYVLKNSLEVKEKMVENWDRWKWLNDNHTISIYVSNVGNPVCHKQPVGRKPQNALVSVLKKMLFLPWRDYWSTEEKVTKIPANFHWFFDQLLQFTGNLLCQTRAMFSSFHMAIRFCKERPVISKKLCALEFIQRHCQTLMLRISFGFTWLSALVGRLHGMADFDSRHIASTPPVCIRTVLFLIPFLIQNTPFQEWMDVPSASISPGHWQKKHNIT